MRGTTISVELRGMISDVVIDDYSGDDPETNAGTEIEWHFDGLSPEEHDDLHLTDDERDAIHEQLARYISEHAGSDD